MKYTNPLLFFFLLVIIAVQSSCYSFRGISIDPTVNTFYVTNFRNNAVNSLVALEQTFTRELREKIRTESRLVFTEEEPDVEFNGTIVDFRISSEAPSTGETAAINRLTVVIAIEFVDNLNEENNWKKNFTDIFDFDSNQDFSAVEEEALDDVITQLMEDIFNQAFSNW